MKTIYSRNDAYSVEADPEGVRIQFKKRMALPLLSPTSAEDLARLLITAAKESRRHNHNRTSDNLPQPSNMRDFRKDGPDND